jgi:acyl carrier protein
MEQVVTVAGISIIEKVSDFIIANFLFGEGNRMPDPADSLIETGIIDSTGILELIEFLESEFGIAIREEETIPQNLDGLDNLAFFIARKLEGKA